MMKNRDAIEKDLHKKISRFENRLTYLRSKSERLSWYRLIIFFISLILFFIFFFTGSNAGIYSTITIFIALFGILTSIHNNLERCIRKNILWTMIIKLHISRMNLKWDELPPSAFDPDDKHPFEADLNITGEFSLHRLINTASTFTGSKILRNWLTCYEPSAAEIKRRQMLVKELIELNRFRDKLSLHSSLAAKKEISGTKLQEWMNLPSVSKNIYGSLITLGILVMINIFLFVLYLTGIIPSYFVLTTAIYFGVYWFNTKYTKSIFDDLLEVKDDFGRLSTVFDFLESYSYKNGSRLKEFCTPFIEKSPSKDFRKIQQIIDAVSITRNPFVGLIFNLLFPYNLFFAYKLEKIKEEIHDTLPLWMDTWYNLEAYCSLANYAHLNPECTFPEINDNQVSVKASRIQHPLIGYNESVPNDFSLAQKGEIFIITGSNMSGKSTFLKTIGINLVMAFAGSAVRAEFLSASLFRVFCCINISDSVTDGISYFYAEVKRLKRLLSELNKSELCPVFILIDEIFKGTNNMERLQGSRAYIKSAAGLNGAGLVSTHDIELSRLEHELPLVQNKHFREEVEESKMIFDYKIHRGPSPTTNALKIMKNEGLPVD